MQKFSALLVSAVFLTVFTAAFAASPALAKDNCAKAAQISSEADDMALTNPGGAEKRLRQAIDLCGTSASLHYNLAMTLYKQGRNLDAEAALDQAIKINPEYAKALNALAYLLITRQADLARARTLAQKAVAIDPKNSEFKSTLDMLAGNIDNPPKTKVNRPDAIAVVIGNKNYKNTTLPAVKYALQDAAIMKRYLVESLGFDENNVYLIRDAANIDFVKYFGNENDHKGILYNRTRKDHADIFIFYSGHGAPDTNTKKAFLVPSDADPSIIKLTGYPLDTLYGNLAKLSKEKNTKSMTIVLDSCFSGGSNDGMIIQNASPIFIEASSPVLTMKNAAVFSSSKGNQISSWYTDKNHGLFTYFFLKNIKDAIESNKQLTAGDMEKALQGSDSVNDVAWRMYNREQEPQVTGDKSVMLVQ